MRLQLKTEEQVKATIKLIRWFNVYFYTGSKATWQF